MGTIKVSRRKEIVHSFEKGLSRQKILVGEYSQAAFEACAMKPGALWAPPPLQGGRKESNIPLYLRFGLYNHAPEGF